MGVVAKKIKDETGIYRLEDGRLRVQATAKCPVTGKIKKHQRTLPVSASISDAKQKIRNLKKMIKSSGTIKQNEPDRQSHQKTLTKVPNNTDCLLPSAPFGPLVYFIRHDMSNLYKIGYTSRSPKKRISGLQCGNPKPLHLVATIPTKDRDLEAKTQRIAEEHGESIRGEWFLLGVEELKIVYWTAYDLAQTSLQTSSE